MRGWVIFSAGLQASFCRFLLKMIFKSFAFGGGPFRAMIRDAHWV
jgi:hypothetical protein